MHQHGPTELNGPVRGTGGWWQGMGDQPEPAEADPSEPIRTKKGKRMARGKRSARRGDGSIRAALVERVRGEIAAGTYDSPEKWEAALDRLLDRLERE